MQQIVRGFSQICFLLYVHGIMVSPSNNIQAIPYRLEKCVFNVYYHRHSYHDCRLYNRGSMRDERFPKFNLRRDVLRSDCSESNRRLFQCDNRKCISMSLYCDFRDDCGDLSDEKHCGRWRLFVKPKITRWPITLRGLLVLSSMLHGTEVKR